MLRLRRPKYYCLRVEWKETRWLKIPTNVFVLSTAYTFLYPARGCKATNPTDMLLSGSKVLVVEFVLCEKAIILTTNVFAVHKSFFFILCSHFLFPAAFRKVANPTRMLLASFYPLHTCFCFLPQVITWTAVLLASGKLLEHFFPL